MFSIYNNKKIVNINMLTTFKCKLQNFGELPTILGFNTIVKI